MTKVASRDHEERNWWNRIDESYCGQKAGFYRWGTIFKEGYNGYDVQNLLNATHLCFAFMGTPDNKWRDAEIKFHIGWMKRRMAENLYFLNLIGLNNFN